MEEREGKCGLLKAELRVEVRDKRGKLIDVRESKSDLILNNFRNILAALLKPYEDLAAKARRDASTVDLGGTSRSIPVWGNYEGGWDLGVAFTGAHKSPSWPIGVRIRIGTSTVAPSRGDYKLGAEVAYGTPSQTVGADYISWAISITLTTAADIAEAGMSCFFQLATAASTATCEVLLFRDTFTPVSVPAGGTISVTYKLTL